jgi:cellulose synthase (UDP-forming)
MNKKHSIVNAKKIPAFQKVIKIPVIRTWWESAITYILLISGFISVIIFGYWWFQDGNIARNFSGLGHIFDFLLFALLTFVVWYQIVNEMLAWELVFSMARPGYIEPKDGLKVALCTAFVPGKEPYDVLEETLKAMAKVRYPHDNWLLDEGDDLKSKELCAKYGVRHFSRKGRPEYNTAEGKYKAKTKAGNFNSWFDQHSSKYDIVAQHDMDFKPKIEFLERTLGYFRDTEVAFVGTPQIYANINESWIARGAAEQAYGFYGVIQKGLFGHDMQLFIGANHVIRRKAHDDILGYSGHIVEDHLTGMRLYAKRWKSVYVPEILLEGEGPATWAAYFSQQMRWAFGLMDILFRHSPKIFPKMKQRHSFHYFLLQQYYFFGLAQAIGIFLISLYFFFGIQSTAMELNTLLILYPSLLIIQLLNFIWLQRFYIDPKKESGFHLRGKLLSMAAWPIYFIAFIGAVLGRKLSYEVTPKGSAQKDGEPAPVSLFTMHMILGAATGAGLITGFFTGHNAPQIVFWAMINTFFMSLFVLLAIYGQLSRRMRKFAARERILRKARQFSAFFTAILS